MACGEHGIELLVKKIARKVARSLPASVQIEDLFQSGMVGWIAASRKYDETIAVSFDKFASIYIYGAIFDSLRDGSWVPRDLSRRRRDIEKARHELAGKNIHFPSAMQIADQLNIPIDSYHKISQELVGIYPDSLEEKQEREDIVDEHDFNIEIEEVCRWEELEANINALPLLPRLIVKMHYNQEISVAKIARTLNMREYPARKILKETIIDLKAAMRDWWPEEAFKEGSYK